jgi:phage terminase large subunit-like protein
MCLPALTVSSAAAEAIELAAECGVVLDEFQESILDGGMSETADGRWAASDVAVIASRQNGKNGAVEVRELAGAVLYGETVIHTAHLFPTARSSFQRIEAIIDESPDVKERVTRRLASPAAGYEVHFRGGGLMKFIARSRTSGRGLTGDLLILDEAQDLDDDALGALLPTISARSKDVPGSQAWYLGSAPGPLSTVLHRVRKRGRGGDTTRFAFFEFSADPGADLDDRVAWAEANPALGRRITEEFVASEREAMSDEMFARERLSISPDLLEDGEDGLPRAAWRACGEVDEVDVPLSTIDGRVAFAIDMPWSRERTVIVAAGEASDVDGVPLLDEVGRRRDHLEVVERRSGSRWVVARVLELRELHGPVAVALDPSGPAGALVADLQNAGIELVLPTGREYAQACGAFLDAVVDRRVVHVNDPLLNTAAAGAMKRTRADAFVWDRRGPNEDISPIVAATIARWALASTVVDAPIDSEMVWDMEW